MVNNNNSSNSNSTPTSHSYEPEDRTVTFEIDTNNLSRQDINHLPLLQHILEVVIIILAMEEVEL